MTTAAPQTSSGRRHQRGVAFAGCEDRCRVAVCATLACALSELFASHIMTSEFHLCHRNTTTSRALIFTAPIPLTVWSPHPRPQAQYGARWLEKGAGNRGWPITARLIGHKLSRRDVSKCLASKMHAFETVAVAKLFRHGLLRPTYPSWMHIGRARPAATVSTSMLYNSLKCSHLQFSSFRQVHQLQFILVHSLLFSSSIPKTS